MMTLTEQEKYARLILIVLAGGILSAKARGDGLTFATARIAYKNLAQAIDFPIKSTAGKLFGSQMGNTLANMRVILDGVVASVPLIEVLAVRAMPNGLPGPGFSCPCPGYNFKANRGEKEKIVEAEFAKVLKYDKWADVLEKMDWRASYLVLNRK